MDVVGSDGPERHSGTVDHVDYHRMKLAVAATPPPTRGDCPTGLGAGMVIASPAHLATRCAFSVHAGGQARQSWQGEAAAAFPRGG